MHDGLLDQFKKNIPSGFFLLSASPCTENIYGLHVCFEKNISTSYHMHAHQTVLALCVSGRKSERETSIPTEAPKL